MLLITSILLQTVLIPHRNTQPLRYTVQRVSWHPELRTREFNYSHILLPERPCWWQLAHFDYGEDAKVLLSGVTYIVSIPNAKSVL